ncbi:MAG: sodium:proton antiporter [Myxococcota bacterium]
MTEHPAFTLALALAVGIVAQSLARHLRVPGIVLLLAAGAGLGPDGLGWVQPDALGVGLIATVQLAVAVILFEGGLNLEISRLRREQAAIRRLVTWGALVTLAGGAIAAHLIFGWPIMRSLLFGSLVVVTGPTVIGPLVRELRLKPRVATVLEAEGVLIDPVGAILAVLLLELAIAPDTETQLGGGVTFLLQFGFGAGAGVLTGYALAGILRVRRLIPEGLENGFVLAAVLLLFQACDAVVHESGILAVTVAGVVVGNLRSRVDRDLREFKDQLTILLIGLLFVLLAADVRIAEVQALGMRGLALVAALVLVVRPLGVWLCTMGSDLNTKERLFVSWIAPRGIVAAAVASVTSNALLESGDAGGNELRALVFLTIAGTVVLAGFTAGPVASLLGVRLPSRDRVAILGASGLGLKLGEWLRSVDVPVVFLDSNAEHVRQAEESGFSVVFGDAVQERTMLRARFESVGSVVGLTPNQVLNSVYASRSREFFGVPQAYIAVMRAGTGIAPDLVQKGDARTLFEGPHDAERWEVRVRHGDVAVEEWSVGEPPTESLESKTGERLVFLGHHRGKTAGPMHAGIKLAKGDRVAVAIYEPDRAEAEEVLRTLGLEPAEPAD